MAALTLTLVLAACGEDFPAPIEPPAPDPPPPDLDVIAVSGGGQEGKAGEPLPEPFVVRVIDADGEPVLHVDVTWTVSSGLGDFVRKFTGIVLGSDEVTETHAQGETRIYFQPEQLGTSTVVAEVVSSRDARATFTVDATERVINLRPIFASHCTDDVDPPKFSPEDVTVPVGTPVEWVFWFRYGDGCEAHVTSVLVPPSGEAFDSGVLGPGDRLRFVPEVAGTWEYRDEVTGETGRLTAQ